MGYVSSRPRRRYLDPKVVCLKFFGGDVRSGSHFLNQEIDATIYLFCCGSIGFCCFFSDQKKQKSQVGSCRSCKKGLVSISKIKKNRQPGFSFKLPLFRLNSRLDFFLSKMNYIDIHWWIFYPTEVRSRWVCCANARSC